MIQVKDVSFEYENALSKNILKNIIVKIPKGQVVLLCGASGSGKTTFTRLLNGLIPNYYAGKNSGKVEVYGKQIENTALHELAPIVGSVFQNPKSQFYTLMTDTEIVFACENIGIEKTEILERFTKTVKVFGLEKLLGKNLFELSGGEKQKIACASVNALCPEIFVLDEPTANLDIRSIYELGEILKFWKNQGKTIVIAEHRLEWLNEIADRVLYFDDSIKLDMDAEEFWRLSKEELHNMGLRASIEFEPRYKGTFKEWIECRKFQTKILDIPKLKIPLGATVAILGNNGAGKTTFARVLCGLDKKAEGTLLYKGEELNRKKMMELCYMVMQDVNHQLFADSVEDEVRLGMNLKTGELAEGQIDDILKALDLLEHKKAHPMSLSGGQRQRVAIAGALAAQREFIIYDEPTSGLDYRRMKEVAGCIRKLSAQGITQLVITHDAELVAECCDYFIFMDKGKILCSGEWTEDNVEYIKSYFATYNL